MSFNERSTLDIGQAQSGGGGGRLSGGILPIGGGRHETLKPETIGIDWRL